MQYYKNARDNFVLFKWKCINMIIIITITDIFYIVSRRNNEAVMWLFSVLNSKLYIVTTSWTPHMERGTSIWNFLSTTPIFLREHGYSTIYRSLDFLFYYLRCDYWLTNIETTLKEGKLLFNPNFFCGGLGVYILP